VEILLAQILIWHLVPHTSTIVTDFDTLRPSAATECPPSERDFAIVDNDVVVDGRHDRRRDGHGLNTEPVAVRDVLLAHLRGVVEVLLHLDRRHGRRVDDVDAGKPFAGTRANVSHDYDTEREAVDRRERLAVHLPGEQNLVNLHLAHWHRDGVVVHLPLLEVRVCAEELDMASIVFESTAVFDDLLQGHTGPARCTDGALTPGCVDELVTVTGVFVDLFDTACAGALETDDGRLTGKDRFILQHVESDLLGVVDETFDFEVVLAGIDLGDAAVVTDEEVGVVCDLGLD
jgi:hypothetical protein